jgi:uncharacterized protein (TIGR02231 family)
VEIGGKTNMDKINANIPIKEVILLEDRAYISREANLKLAKGQYTLCLKDVSPVISDKTLSAEVVEQNNISVIDINIERTVKIKDDNSVDKLTDIEKKIKLLTTEKKIFLNKKTVLESRIQSASQIIDLLFQEIPEDISWGRVITDEAMESTQEFDKTIETSGLQLQDIEKKLQDLNQQISDLDYILSTLKSPATRYSADILIRIQVMENSTFNLKVEYQVPQVCWRPRYRVEMLTNEIDFHMEGNVWQNTGEDWSDVQLYFSTQRISDGVEPPILSEDSISIQKKPKEELIEIREQEIQQSGGGSVNDSSSDEIPGIDDCGSVQTLKATGLFSIPSDGFPYRIEIAEFKADMETDLLALPELSNYVYIRSRQRNEMKNPILAGPVDLIRKSGLAGRTSVLFIAPGENFELAWGPDPDMRINRVEDLIEEKTGPLNSWASVKHRIVIRFSNIGLEKKELTITERLPVSELEKVQIIFNDKKTSSGFSFPDKNGMVIWKIEMPALGRETLNMEYTVRRHKAVLEVGV